MPKNVSQSKNAKKMAHGRKFSAPVSTGRKVEMASANAVLWEKEKLLVTSNFSFSDSVFKSCRHVKTRACLEKG